MDSASCTYGCGTKLEPEDGGYCPSCKEHSNNQVECTKCGALADVGFDGKVDLSTVWK
jgi:hypothetical protein